MSDELVRLEALDVDRDILLQAPAGSGKTTVLAQRFLAALATVDEPEQVLAITFTRKAAAEMRERVLLALEGALPPTQADLPRWQQLAAQVHQHGGRRGWRPEELPTRLRIQTIDSLAHEIARAMPLLGRVYASLNVIDAADELYAQAAREALRFGAAEARYRGDVDVLLHRLDNDWDRAQQLLAGLLPSRNRWQPVLLEHQPEELADRVATSLQRIAAETLAEAALALSSPLLAEGAALATASALHRRDAGHESGTWSAWLQPDVSLAPDAMHVTAWKAVVGLALKVDGDLREKIDTRQGFPATDKALKQRWQVWVRQLQQQSGVLQVLRAVDALPPATIDGREREALAALARLMLLAAMHLKLVFREHALVDHNEVSAVARQALHGLDGPTDQSIRETLRVRHLLVDEFQDTSPDQLELVRDLICGWHAGDKRSLFLVGDPMQSIYLFRNSEVGLFLQTRAGGVGDISLEARQLSRNFRSMPQLVDWANEAFRCVFPALENLRSSAVTFLPSQAARGGDGDAAAVTVWPQTAADPDGEAAVIAAEIRKLRACQPAVSVAVLVQTRSLAAPVLRALQSAGVLAQGIDLAMLADRSVVRDLVAMGQALLDAGDRTAWLAVLRGPCCGLVLADLKLLCDDAGRRPLVEVIADQGLASQLSLDGQRRLARVGPRLLRAWNTRGSRDIASAIENLWYELGGHAACQDAAELGAARQYLLALRRLQDQAGRIDGQDLQELAGQLRDRSEVAGNHPVEVLTIHHAKGLEWDVVFVPGLGKAARSDTPPLLRWLQLPAATGTDLLLAVHSIGDPDTADPLARYIAGLQAERLQNERARLLYVAVTRARQRLYLSGHAPWSRSQGARIPSRRSLLHLLWPAVRSVFHDGPTEEEVAQTGDSQSLEAPWLRLPADYQGRAAAELPVESLSRTGADVVAGPEFSWVGPLARAAGTVMHAEFERLAALSPGADHDPASRLQACVARLREHGIATEQAGQTAAAIVRQLVILGADQRVHWLVREPHRDAHSELRLSAIVDGELRNVVIDRTFVDAEGTRWIIDYKTSQHAGGGMEEFLAREMERYGPQLRLYRAMAQRLGPEPVRAALYFPWLRQFREFEPLT